jgi:hypothetical protein
MNKFLLDRFDKCNTFMPSDDLSAVRLLLLLLFSLLFCKGLYSTAFIFTLETDGQCSRINVFMIAVKCEKNDEN